MVKKLLDQLNLCVATGTPQLIFAQQPTSFSTFCAHLMDHEGESTRKRTFQELDTNEDSVKKQIMSKGSIINTTGKKIVFPKGLKNRYCADFLVVGSTLTAR